jgi:ubiquinone/menaquinone biosynthesis C-methylase UbiE
LIALTPRQAYGLWAPSYRGDNAVCVLEDQLVSTLTPMPQGRRLLDVGCGTGLRLRDCGAAIAFGVDASTEMLSASGLDCVAAADVRALPFPGNQFDLVWCRLMLSYLPDLKQAYAELARVCHLGGDVVISDFHADAIRAGHHQTFRDAAGTLHEIIHYAHDAQAHEEAAAASGLMMKSAHSGTVDASIKHIYQRANHLDMYARDQGLAIVALFHFEKAYERVNDRSVR